VLKKVDAIMSFLSVFPKDDIRFNYSLAGGVMMDCGCYTLNAIRYFSGLEVESVQEARPKIISPEIDGRMDAVLNLSGSHSPGAIGTLNASLTNPYLSIDTWRNIMPAFVAETDTKIFTFGVWVMPTVYTNAVGLRKKKVFPCYTGDKSAFF